MTGSETTDGGPNPVAVVSGAVSATILATLPPCLLGALGPVIRTDLGFDGARLGIAVGAFYAASTLAALVSGRFSVAERVGVRRSIVGGVGLVMLVMAGIAVLAENWVQVAVGNAVAGLANGLTQPAANLALANRVPARRMGLAFGVKQAAVPAATLLAGLAVGLLTVLGGWRTAFGIGAGLSVLFLAGSLTRPGPRRGSSPSAASGRPRSTPLTRPLALATAGSALASVGVNAMRVFFIEAAVDRGEDIATAGFVLALASLAGILTRLFSGWRSDHVARDPYTSAAVLVLAGAAGNLLMVVADGTMLLVLAAALGISAGWGWSGLVQLGTVRAHPQAPGAASAFIHSGSLFGSLCGPVLFGLLLVHGFPAAWMTVAAITVVGGLLLLVVGRDRRPSPP